MGIFARNLHSALPLKVRQFQLKMRQICLVSVFFGEFPWYFRYFIHTCAFNPTIDFLIFADSYIPESELPDNVKIVNLTLEEFNQIATIYLGLKINISSPYKICDFKPTYGLLFKEFLKPYDFWGHIDLDVIWGDVRAFITNDILKKNELICVRHDFLTGYFLLFKNTRKMNLLFTKSKDFKKVFLSDRHFCFDETNFQFTFFSKNIPLEEMNSEIESMMHVVRKMQIKNQIKAYFDFMVIEGLPGKITWSNGKLFYKNKFEVLLYHMILFKRIFKPKRMVEKIPNEFRISPTRIYHV